MDTMDNGLLCAKWTCITVGYLINYLIKKNLQYWSKNENARKTMGLTEIFLNLRLRS